MKDLIIFSVSKGSKIVGPNGSVVIIGSDVPDNALDLIEAGATYLMFKKEAKDQLKKLPKDRLVKILDMRKSQKLIHDVSVLEMALAEKEAGKDKSDLPVIKEKSTTS